MVTLFAALMLAMACDTAPSASPKAKRLYSPPGTDLGLSHRADLVAGDPENGFTIDTAWQPIPSQSEGVIFNGESTDDLRALGYIE